MNITQSAHERQETFTPLGPRADHKYALDGEDGETEEAEKPETRALRRPSKLQKRPDFIKVPRAALKRADLDVRDALTYGLVVYRDFIGSRISATAIAETFGWDRTTGWRALTRLRAVGLIDAEDAPIAGALSDRGGFLKVRVDHVRELGNLEAVTLTQLQSYGSLRMCHFVGRHMVVTARGLSSLIGCCLDTAIDVLKRLGTGLTNRVKRAQRTGAACVIKARIEILRALGRGARVRLLGEREQKPIGQTKSRSAAEAPSKESVRYVPTPAEMAVLLNTARRQHPT